MFKCHTFLRCWHNFTHLNVNNSHLSWSLNVLGQINVIHLWICLINRCHLWRQNCLNKRWYEKILFPNIFLFKCVNQISQVFVVSLHFFLSFLYINELKEISMQKIMFLSLTMQAQTVSIKGLFVQAQLNYKPHLKTVTEG